VTFAHPFWLFLVWTVPVALALYVMAHVRRSRLLGDYATTKALERIAPARSNRRRWARAILVLVSLLLVSIAVSGPRYGHKWRNVERKGVDLVVALDCSRSMLAEDLKPNRLERAKREVVDLLNALEGDRVGLVAFAGTAFLQCPLTLDYAGSHLFLQTLSPDFLPVGGTALAAAIDVARAGFDPESPAEKAVVLITDGEATQGDPLAAAEEAAREGIRVFVIGVGSEAGAPIPQSKGGFVKDQDGNIVLARLEEESLQRIAAATGGAYTRSVTGDMDLDLIYTQEIRGRMEAKTLEGGKVKVWEDRYQWPLAVAVITLFAGLALPLRKRSRAPLLMPLLLTTLVPTAAQAASAPGLVREGLKAYDSEDYAAALDAFAKAQLDAPEAPEIAYDIGNAQYRSGEYEKALESYSAALRDAPPELRGRTLYNMGNAAYRLGRLEEAAKHYEAALKLAPADEDGRLNLEFVRRQIEQQQQQQGDGDESDDKKENQESENQGENRSGEEQGEQQQQQGSSENRSGEEKHESQPQQNRQQDEENQDEGSRADASPEEQVEREEAEQREAAASSQAEDEGESDDSDEAERRRAASVLNRLQDQPGKAMIPAYRERRVEKDW
jgi:Ca-activated chloride channel family protein